MNICKKLVPNVPPCPKKKIKKWDKVKTRDLGKNKT